MNSNDRRLNFLGLRPTGDLAGLTAYTSRRGKIVWFPKSPPMKPASTRQRVQRARFRFAANAWRRLTEGQRHAYRTAARSSHLYLTGYTLFLTWQTTRDLPTIRTIERISGVKLLND